MKNEKLKNAWEKAKNWMTNAGKIAIILIAMIVGFFANDIYRKVNSDDSTKVMNIKDVHTVGETSVAINERNELMLIDRATGTYEIYQDSIGQTIFSMYAGQIYRNTVAPKKSE